MFRLVAILLITLISLSVKGQYYIKGQEPANLKWFEHQAVYGRLVFPNGLDSIASIYTQYMDSAWRVVPRTLSHSPRPTPIVLHNNSVLSNGFVSWAPRRMEVVTTPSHDASPVPWLQTLSLHETRHVVQIDKLNHGLIKAGFFLFGEQVVGAIAGAVPIWFLEGDAVYSETEYTYGGRGRQAEFYEQYRTHLLSKGGNKFTYDKWLLGSYKDKIPNHYSFGYLMVGYTNLKYGYNVWNNALNKTAKQPYLIIPFYFSLKKDLNLPPKKLFEENLNYLDSLWVSNQDTLEEDKHRVLTNKEHKNDYVEYKTPVSINDSIFIAVKTSLKRTPKVIKYNSRNHKEVVLFNPGHLTHKRLSASKRTVFWSEYRPHPRWEYVNYSEIWSYNLDSEKKRKISHKTKYFNPIQVSSSRIAVIEQNPKGFSQIVFINSIGEKKDSLAIPPTLELREICLGNDDQIFARCASPEGAIILNFYNYNTKPDTILGPVFRDISNISYSKNNLYFTATEKYLEQIFSVNLETNEISSISTSSYGLSDVSSSINNIILATMNTPKGSIPVSVLSDNHNPPISFSNTIKPLYHPSKQNQPPHSKILQFNIQDTTLKTRKHNKIRNLFHFHSWAPVYFNPFDLAAGKIEIPFPGVTLISQNLTSTLATSLGYSYNETHGVHAHAEWQGWYPKFSASFDYGNEFAVYNGGPNPDNNFGYRSEPMTRFTARARVPYFYTAGKSIFQANLGVQYTYTNTWLWDSKNEEYSDRLSSIGPYILMYAAQRMAHRDLRPRFGTYIYYLRSEFPKTQDLLGNENYFTARFFLPGFLSNQSLLLTTQWEKHNGGKYLLNPQLTFPRGHEKISHEQAFAFKADFAFPVAYTDFPIGPVVYIKRVFANIFSDNAWLNIYELEDNGWTINRKTLHSAGVEINADVNFFRTPYQFRIGYRAGIIPEQKTYFHNFIISFDVNSMYGYLSNNFIKLNL